MEGGGEGQKMEGKGGEFFHSTFLAHFVFILYSKSNMSPLEGRLQAISLFWQSLLPWKENTACSSLEIDS